MYLKLWASLLFECCLFQCWGMYVPIFMHGFSLLEFCYLYIACLPKCWFALLEYCFVGIYRETCPFYHFSVPQAVYLVRCNVIVVPLDLISVSLLSSLDLSTTSSFVNLVWHKYTTAGEIALCFIINSLTFSNSNVRVCISVLCVEQEVCDFGSKLFR